MFPELTATEFAVLEEDVLRSLQLKNIQAVMNSSITPKKLKRMETDVLPGYIVRQRNARSAAEKLMKKYRMTRSAR